MKYIYHYVYHQFDITFPPKVYKNILFIFCAMITVVKLNYQHTWAKLVSFSSLELFYVVGQV